MFEQLIDAPLLLRPGHLVHFDNEWPSGTNKQDKWFKVLTQYQIKYDVARNIASGATIDLSFDSVTTGIDNTNLALLPINPDTLYEILLGFKTSDVMVYPYFANSFVLGLEATNVLPVVADRATRPFRELRYLGFWEPEDSPYDAPRIREHTVKGQEPPVLRLYNDGGLADRIVVRILVNRCTLEETQAPRDQQLLDRARRPMYVTGSRLGTDRRRR